MSRFPRLYALEEEKSATVADKLKTGANSWTWRRPLRGGRESEELEKLKDIIRDCSLSYCPDGWIWSLNSNGTFSVKSIRVHIDKVFLGVGDKETRWNPLIPPKVNIFRWRASLDRIPSRGNLLRLNVELDSALCPFCSVSVETTNHLLFVCSVSMEVWRFIERCWCFSFPYNRTLDTMTYIITSTYGNNLLGKAMEAVLFTGCYVLWCLCNRLIFDRRPPQKDTILDQIIEKSFSWVLARCKGSRKNPITWRCHPTNCVRIF